MYKWVQHVREEGKNIWEFEKRELKSLVVISLFTFCLMFFSIFSISLIEVVRDVFSLQFWEGFVQTVLSLFDKIFSIHFWKGVIEVIVKWFDNVRSNIDKEISSIIMNISPKKMLDSLLVTFIVVAIWKRWEFGKKEKFTWVSITVLDKFANLCLDILGVSIAVFIGCIFWFISSDDFKFSLIHLILIFIAFSWFMLNVHILFKYPSEKLKKFRETGECNGWIFIIFMVLFIGLCYFSVKFLFLCLNLVTQNIK